MRLMGEVVGEPAGVLSVGVLPEGFGRGVWRCVLRGRG